MDLEIVTQSEVSQTVKDKYHMMSLTCQMWKKETNKQTNKLVYKGEIDPHMWKTNLLPVGKARMEETDKYKNWDWDINQRSQPCHGEVKWKPFIHVRVFASPGKNSPWNSPSQNTGVSSCSLLQGIFPSQESNQGLLHCRYILYQLNTRE